MTSSLEHYVRIYDGWLSQSLCDRLIDSFEKLERFHELNGASRRTSLSDSQWTELNVTRMSDATFRAFFQASLADALQNYNRDVKLEIPIPNSPKTSDLIIKRYLPGGHEKFQVHFDSINEVSNRYLVFLWYLNDVAEGGETVFPNLPLTIAAKKGRLIIFPPYWMYQHTGLPPVSCSKFILSTYLLF